MHGFFGWILLVLILYGSIYLRSGGMDVNWSVGTTARLQNRTKISGAHPYHPDNAIWIPQQKDSNNGRKTCVVNQRPYSKSNCVEHCTRFEQRIVQQKEGTYEKHCKRNGDSTGACTMSARKTNLQSLSGHSNIKMPWLVPYPDSEGIFSVVNTFLF